MPFSGAHCSMKHEASREGDRWLAQAERDLRDAQFLLSGGKYNMACFLAQQAAEKALAGYLYWKGAEDVWGNSIGDLCEDAALFDQTFHVLKVDTVYLDKYFYITRYPRYLPSGIPSEAFDEEEARRATFLAEGVIRFVKERAEGHS